MRAQASSMVAALSAAPKDRRTAEAACAGVNPMASNTGLGAGVPALQAEPPLMRRPAASNTSSSRREATPGTEKFSVVGRQAEGGALNTRPGSASVSAAVSRAR